MTTNIFHKLILFHNPVHVVHVGAKTSLTYAPPAWCRGSTNKHWSENHQFGSRAIFRTSIEPAQLVLTNVEQSDSGSYTCRVDFRCYKLPSSPIFVLTLLTQYFSSLTNMDKYLIKIAVSVDLCGSYSSRVSLL